MKAVGTAPSHELVPVELQRYAYSNTSLPYCEGARGVYENVPSLIGVPLCCAAFDCKGGFARTPQAVDDAFKLRFACKDC
jgi:hypothetical protein